MKMYLVFFMAFILIVSGHYLQKEFMEYGYWIQKGLEGCLIVTAVIIFYLHDQSCKERQMQREKKHQAAVKKFIQHMSENTLTEILACDGIQNAVTFQQAPEPKFLLNANHPLILAALIQSEQKQKEWAKALVLLAKAEETMLTHDELLLCSQGIQEMLNLLPTDCS